MRRGGRDRHPQDGGAAARLGTRATRGHAVALAILAAAILLGGLGLEAAHRFEGRADAAIEAADARLKALRRIASRLPDLLDPERRAAAVARLDEAWARLRGAEAELARLAAGAAEAAGGEAGGAGLEARLAAALEGARSGEPPRLEIEALLEDARGPLLASFEQAAEQARRRHREAELLEQRVRWGILATILAIILAESLLLFRPLTRRLVGQAAELERLARQDPTTGLLTRGAFLAALDHELAARRPAALVVVDLDHFKEVNDAEGHEAGDTVLRAAAARLREVLRGADSIGRLGGDELACLLPEAAGARPLETVASRLRAALHEPVPFRGRQLRAGATIGIARYPHDADTAERLLRAADEALMRAKRAGRGGVGRASADDAPRIERLAALLRSLDVEDLDDGLPGLAAALQPVVALARDPLDPAALLGFEALARWTHPSLGAIAPEELFPAAAASGRAARLGRAVRRRAMAAFAGLGGAAVEGRYLAVNLSPAEVLHGELLAELEADLAAHGLPWRALCLEITEQILLDRVSDERLAGLLRLRERGVRLALDDFGTGSSGLAQLLRLPIDILKIERRFVAAVTADGRAREIVRATLGLAAGLGLEVVAEGIEERAQAALLARLGCHAGQGWLFGRPLQGEALVAFWRERARPAADLLATPA